MDIVCNKMNNEDSKMNDTVHISVSVCARQGNKGACVRRAEWNPCITTTAMTICHRPGVFFSSAWVDLHKLVRKQKYDLKMVVGSCMLFLSVLQQLGLGYGDPDKYLIASCPSTLNHSCEMEAKVLTLVVALQCMIAVPRKTIAW